MPNASHGSRGRGQKSAGCAGTSGGVGVFAEGATERRAAIATSTYRKRVEHAALPTIQDLADSEPAIGLAFQPGIPAFDVFPRLVWSGLPKRHDQRIDQSALDYAHYGGGYAPLRQAIAAYLVGSISWPPARRQTEEPAVSRRLGRSRPRCQDPGPKGMVEAWYGGSTAYAMAPSALTAHDPNRRAALRTSRAATIGSATRARGSPHTPPG